MGKSIIFDIYTLVKDSRLSDIIISTIFEIFKFLLTNVRNIP